MLNKFCHYQFNSNKHIRNNEYKALFSLNNSVDLGQYENTTTIDFRIQKNNQVKQTSSKGYSSDI